MIHFELLFYMVPKAQVINNKIGKLDFMNIKTFVLLKTAKKVKRNATDWEEMLQIIYLISDLH